MNKVEGFLKDNGIEYELHTHPAVFTVEEAAKYREAVPGMACKNLLIRTKDDGRLFLVTLAANKRFDFKKFGEIVGNKKLTFANNDVLKQVL